MTDPLDYIRENLLHDPDCNDGFPDMTKADGCTCHRAEVIAWAESRYRAGRESMRREAAGVCRGLAPAAPSETWNAAIESCADAIEALEVGDE